jgi:hypothetical protein
VFRASAPVTATGFFDRTRELAVVQAVIDALAADAPRWLAILGPRRVGKTSLLLEAARRAPASVRVAVLDVMERAPLDVELFRSIAVMATDALLSESAGGSLEQWNGKSPVDTVALGPPPPVALGSNVAADGRVGDACPGESWFVTRGSAAVAGGRGASVRQVLFR